MPAPAIKVQGLSKEYIIGRHQKGQETFREMVAGALAAPFQRLRKMRGSVVPEERFWALKPTAKSLVVMPGEIVDFADCQWQSAPGERLGVGPQAPEAGIQFFLVVTNIGFPPVTAGNPCGTGGA